MKKSIAFFGLLLLLVFEIARVYFIMPFPGSQKSNSIELAYWIGNKINYIRFLLLAVVAYSIVSSFRTDSLLRKISLGVLIGAYAVVCYFINFRFLADKMFYQPTVISFADSATNNIATDKLVLGVEVNGEAKAYPIQLIGYHHQVRDSIGGKAVMVTYCTVCRTGRVYDPIVNGESESFRLVGMDHFNAMFEDGGTGSWWRQATGEAVVGPLKGTSLKEIPSRQMRLSSWLRLFPQSTILQPDTIFKKDYDDLAKFDEGTIESGLEKRDSLSWKDKSWVVGISDATYAKAYDWNELVAKRLVQDSFPSIHFMIIMEKDSASFHSYNRLLDSNILHFQRQADDVFVDLETSSLWDVYGNCLEGKYKGRKLNTVSCYQEFWHSWKTFHPNTMK